MTRQKLPESLSFEELSKVEVPEVVHSRAKFRSLSLSVTQRRIIGWCQTQSWSRFRKWRDSTKTSAMTLQVMEERELIKFNADQDHPVALPRGVAALEHTRRQAEKYQRRC